MTLRRLLCWLFGHEPRGPIELLAPHPLYWCARCERTIQWRNTDAHGWEIVE